MCIKGYYVEAETPSWEPARWWLETGWRPQWLLCWEDSERSPAGATLVGRNWTLSSDRFAENKHTYDSVLNLSLNRNIVKTLISCDWDILAVPHHNFLCMQLRILFDLEPILTSNAILHRVWNSQVSPTLLDLELLEYSFNSAVRMEHATSCCNVTKRDTFVTLEVTLNMYMLHTRGSG